MNHLSLTEIKLVSHPNVRNSDANIHASGLTHNKIKTKVDVRNSDAHDTQNKAGSRCCRDTANAGCGPSNKKRPPKLANTIAAHRTGILAYYDFPISTAPLEGTNNKIKTMQRAAYGFRDKEFFKLKIFAIHRSRYALLGRTLFYFHNQQIFHRSAWFSQLFCKVTRQSYSLKFAKY